MTIEEVKAILGRVRFIEGQIEDAEEELIMLKAKSLKITSALSMGPVHGGTQDKIAQVVADIADMENYIVERTEAYKKMRMKAYKLIELLDSPKDAKFISDWYLKKEKRIATCDRNGYERQGGYKARNRIIREIARKTEELATLGDILT